MGILYALTIGPIIRPNLVNWERLNQKKTDGRIKKQHYITGTKIESARIHLQKLALLAPSRKITDIIKGIVCDDKTNQIQVPVFGLSQVLPFITEYEAFLFSLSGSIDSFLQEVNLFCSLGILTYQVCPQTVGNKMLSKYGNNDLTQHLSVLYGKHKVEWFKYMSGLRNFIAHRICSGITTAIDYYLYLPDRPDLIDVEDPSIRQKFEFFTKMNEMLDKTQNYLEVGYGYLLNLSIEYIGG